MLHPSWIRAANLIDFAPFWDWGRYPNRGSQVQYILQFKVHKEILKAAIEILHIPHQSGRPPRMIPSSVPFEPPKNHNYFIKLIKNCQIWIHICQNWFQIGTWFPPGSAQKISSKILGTT